MIVCLTFERITDFTSQISEFFQYTCRIQLRTQVSQEQKLTFPVQTGNHLLQLGQITGFS